MASVSTTLDPVDRRLGHDVLDTSVTGFGIIEPATVRSVLADAPSGDAISLLVFLRHFG